MKRVYVFIAVLVVPVMLAGLVAVAWGAGVLVKRTEIYVVDEYNKLRRGLVLGVVEEELKGLNLRVEPKKKELVGWSSLTEAEKELATYWLLLRVQDSEATLSEIRGSLEVQSATHNPLAQALF